LDGECSVRTPGPRLSRGTRESWKVPGKRPMRNGLAARLDTRVLDRGRSESTRCCRGCGRRVGETWGTKLPARPPRRRRRGNSVPQGYQTSPARQRRAPPRHFGTAEVPDPERDPPRLLRGWIGYAQPATASPPLPARPPKPPARSARRTRCTQSRPTHRPPCSDTDPSRHRLAPAGRASTQRRREAGTTRGTGGNIFRVQAAWRSSVCNGISAKRSRNSARATRVWTARESLRDGRSCGPLLWTERAARRNQSISGSRRSRTREGCGRLMDVAPPGT
jgi:hypothetical protein